MSEYNQREYYNNALKLVIASLPSLRGTFTYCYILKKLQYAAYCLCEEYNFLQSDNNGLFHGITANRWVINKLLEDGLEINYIADRYKDDDSMLPNQLVILTYPEFYNGKNPALLPELEIASVRFYLD